MIGTKYLWNSILRITYVTDVLQWMVWETRFGRYIHFIESIIYLEYLRVLQPSIHEAFARLQNEFSGDEISSLD